MTEEKRYIDVGELTKTDVVQILFESQYDEHTSASIIENVREMFQSSVNALLKYGIDNGEEMKSFIDEAYEFHKKRFDEMQERLPEILEEISSKVELKIEDENETTELS